MRRTAAALLAAAALLLAAASGAQEKTAAELKKSGNDKMDRFDYPAALEDYNAALRLAPDDVSLYYNIGRVHGLMGHNVEALAALDEFGKRASPEIKARAMFDQLYAQTRARVAFLTAPCDVRGARVMVGGSVVGETPLARTPVNASSAAHVVFEAEGYRTDDREVPLPGGVESRIECRLLRKDTSGTLYVTASPEGATIAVDGQDVGQTYAERPLQAGSHTIVVTRAGYDDAKVPVVIEAGAQKKLTLTLSKSAPLTSKWWFWTSIGVVVVGGVALTAALLTEKSPQAGSIPPGIVSAPLRF